jgi:hypothetical protein
MCDYSLHSVKNRLAVEGEPLFVHKFHTGSKGLASMTDLRTVQNQSPVPRGLGMWAKFKAWCDKNLGMSREHIARSLPAVCIPPGARLEVVGIPSHIQKEFKLRECEDATFTQLSADPFRYRDALRFNNGQEVLIQQLNEGLQVKVLCLTLAEEIPEPQHAAKRVRELVSVRY